MFTPPPFFFNFKPYFLVPGSEILTIISKYLQKIFWIHNIFYLCLGSEKVYVFLWKKYIIYSFIYHKFQNFRLVLSVIMF